MIRYVRVLITVCAFTFFAAVALAAPLANHVFIVSFDGGNAAVMQQSAMPTLKKMMKEGAGTWKAQTTFPSVTLVSHASMLTGVGPAKHNVIWNGWEPERGPLAVTTAFTEAKKTGMTTAMYVSKRKLEHLSLPGSVDSFEVPSSKSNDVAAAVSKHIVEKKPSLCFIHFTDTDSTGHKFGWGSPEQVRAFGDEDNALDAVRDAISAARLAKDSVVILTADHGGHEKTHGTDSPEDMTIPWIAWGKGVKRGFSIAAPVTTYDTAATALWLLDVPIPAEWDGKPVTSAFKRKAVAAAN
ncbi:MAG: alkaline phosphatase family protein [Candidatus Hydrogenedentes bacterium]|nr:alkaline phosphatase family protein [Candidatus Hydrogenedentota bacterium]